MRVLPAGALAVREGYRFSNRSLFVSLEFNGWRSMRLDGSYDHVLTINPGIGGEMLYLNGFARTALTVGPSILVVPTDLDPAGSVGFFTDLRPLGLRWQIARQLILGLDPLSFMLNVPVLSGIPLIQIQYRTALYCETSFP